MTNKAKVAIAAVVLVAGAGSWWWLAANIPKCAEYGAEKCETLYVNTGTLIVPMDHCWPQCVRWVGP